MSLVFNISNARDLLNKLRRDQQRLVLALSSTNEEAIGDALFDFAVTGYSIKDWAKKAAWPHPSGIDVEALVKADLYLQACRDIANSSKHQSITQYVASTSRVYASAGAVFSFSGFDTKGIETSEQKYVPIIKILMIDGIKLEIRQFTENVITAWDGLLTRLDV